MNAFDITEFLTRGSVHSLIEGVPKSAIIEHFGEEFELEDYGKNGHYIHYDNLRFEINQDRMVGIRLEILNSEKQYELELPDEKILVNKDTPLLKMLEYLGKLDIYWEMDAKTSKNGYAALRLGNGLNLFFYYDDQKLETIYQDFFSNLWPIRWKKGDKYFNNILNKITHHVPEFTTDTEKEFQYGIIFEFGQFMMDNINNGVIFKKCVSFIDEALKIGTSITEEVIAVEAFSQFHNDDKAFTTLRAALSKNSVIILDYYHLLYLKN